MTAPAQRILEVMKRGGPATAGGLAAKLGISAVAIRKQLSHLQREHLVDFADRHDGGVGRPRRIWSLSEAGHARFADGHADLAADLIDAISAALGKPGLDAVLGQRQAGLVQRYRTRLKGRTRLAERVALLARLRDAEGYMASAVTRADGAHMLVQHHCPIRAAACRCLGLCRSELEAFSAVLGDSAAVERVEHLLAGDSLCSYLVRPSSG